MAYYGTERIDNFFAHHGIQGQKWGVRRYETAAGYLTPEGKERYSKYYKKSHYKQKHHPSSDISNKTRPSHEKRAQHKMPENTKQKMSENTKQKTEASAQDDADRKRYEKLLKKYTVKDNNTGQVHYRAGLGALRYARNMYGVGKGVDLMTSGSKALTSLAKKEGRLTDSDLSSMKKNEVKLFGGLGLTVASMAVESKRKRDLKFLEDYSRKNGDKSVSQLTSELNKAKTRRRLASIVSTGYGVAQAFMKKK